MQTLARHYWASCVLRHICSQILRISQIHPWLLMHNQYTHTQHPSQDKHIHVLVILLHVRLETGTSNRPQCDLSGLLSIWNSMDVMMHMDQLSIQTFTMFTRLNSLWTMFSQWVFIKYVQISWIFCAINHVGNLDLSVS